MKFPFNGYNMFLFSSAEMVVKNLNTKLIENL